MKIQARPIVSVSPTKVVVTDRAAKVCDITVTNHEDRPRYGVILRGGDNSNVDYKVEESSPGMRLKHSLTDGSEIDMGLFAIRTAGGGWQVVIATMQPNESVVFKFVGTGKTNTGTTDITFSVYPGTNQPKQ